MEKPGKKKSECHQLNVKIQMVLKIPSLHRTVTSKNFPQTKHVYQKPNSKCASKGTAKDKSSSHMHSPDVSACPDFQSQTTFFIYCTFMYYHTENRWDQCNTSWSKHEISWKHLRSLQSKCWRQQSCVFTVDNIVMMMKQTMCQWLETFGGYVSKNLHPGCPAEEKG